MATSDSNTGSFIRHFLSGLGGFLIAKGIVDPNTATQFVGATAQIITGGLAYLFAQGWSLIAKKT